MSANGDRAADLLIFYMRRVWEAAGLGWESDNSAEIRNLTDALIDATREEAAREIWRHTENEPHIHPDGSTA